MPSSVVKEFSKVKLGAKKVVNQDDWSSASEPESDVTEPDDDASEPTYYPDAIKWAVYRDSRKDRSDGRIGWHYGIMWTGYLKSQWDTEEFYECFTLDEKTNQNQMVTDFWNAAERPMVLDTSKKEWLEPPGKLGQVVNPPKSLWKRWIKEARPRRSVKLFPIRLARETHVPRQIIRKRDSDYYWLKRLQAVAAAARSGDGTLQIGDAGPSTQVSRSGSLSQDPSASTSRAGSASAIVGGSGSVTKISVKGKEKAKEPDPALTSLFDDEIIVAPPSERKKKKEEKKRDMDGDQIRGMEFAPPVKSDKGKVKGKEKDKDKEKKRKHDPDSRQGQEGTSGPGKKEKSASPSNVSEPSIPPTTATATARATPASASVYEASLERLRETISPTPTPSVSGLTRRSKQEPLFLDSAPSPADTFGDPLPGIFGNEASTSRPATVEPIDLSTPSPVVDDTFRGDESFEMMEVDSINVAQTVSGKRSRPKSPTKSNSSASAIEARGASKSPTIAQPAAATETAAFAVPIETRQASSTIDGLEASMTAPPSRPPTVNQPSVSAVPEKGTNAVKAPTRQKSPSPIAQISSPKGGTGASPSETPLTRAHEANSAIVAQSTSSALHTIPTSLPSEAEKSTAPPVVAPPPIAIVDGEVADAQLVSQQSSPRQRLVDPSSVPDAAHAPPPEPHSPIIEAPVPTFTSPRQVSHSPSEPMDLDDEEDVVYADRQATAASAITAGGSDSGISPPRYVHELPTTDPIPSTRLSPLPQSAPGKVAIPIADRPKYIQPSRVQLIADVVDPEAEARRLKQARKGSLHPPPPNLPVRPQAQASATYARPPALGPPTQPKGFGVAPPIGPSGAGYGARGRGPLVDQKEMYKAVRPSWQVRKQSSGSGSVGYGGGVSPVPSFGGQSPLYPTPAGPSALRTDQWRPMSAINTGLGGQSPAWNPNAPFSTGGYQSMAGLTGRHLSGGQSPYPPTAVDPRGISPSVMSPNPDINAQSHPQAVNPRQVRGDHTGVGSGQSPLYPPRSPGSGSGSIGPRRIDRIGHLTATLSPSSVDGDPARFHLLIMSGAGQGLNTGGDQVLNMFLGPQNKSQSIPAFMDEVDASLIGWQMRHGAKLVQWAKVGGTPEEAREWDQLKGKALEKHLAWATFTENPAMDNTIVEHFAIVLVQAKVAEQAINSLGLGPWTSIDEIGMALLVLSLPLDSNSPPSLPNPVQPDVDIKDEKPRSIETAYSKHILASYDLSPDFFYSLKGTRTIQYPGQQGHYDILSEFIEHEYKEQGVVPYSDQHPSENVLFANSKFTRSVKSGTLRATIGRKTRFYAAGPDLHLLPSQWGLREIWSTGGLVTFSPTFVLRSPAKFAEIMKMIRVAPNWASYVTPQLVQWVHTSWKLEARCPDPSLAYQTFTQSLFFDNQLLRLSGSPAAAGGGLAVSTCPPHLAHNDICARWMEWHQRISNEKDYSALVGLCNDYTAYMSGRKGKMGMGMDIDMPQEQDLELLDIERKQIEDLTAMHKSPHLLPYRQYIYIGEVSLPKEQKERMGAGIDFVDPDRFAAIFSGVSHSRSTRGSGALMDQAQ